MSWGIFLLCLFALMVWTTIYFGRALWIPPYTRTARDWGRTLAGAWLVFLAGWAVLGLFHLVIG